jgi:hypothetical protein
MNRLLFRRLIAAIGVCLGLFSSNAIAQDPRALVPTTAKRSGLITRQMPITPHLPHDPDRDDFYQTRRADEPPNFDKPNCMLTSGLYGLPLPQDGTLSFRPYFWGSPGGTYGPQNEKVRWRLVGNLIHPWRPVYHYYAGGSYTPVYDLDPLVAGPGPFPFPLLYKKQKQGG